MVPDGANVFRDRHENSIRNFRDDYEIECRLSCLGSFLKYHTYLTGNINQRGKERRTISLVLFTDKNILDDSY